ncbi:MAG: hypothetical protein ACREST_05325, partial [Steroidobacteraceae bacterium]
GPPDPAEQRRLPLRRARVGAALCGELAHEPRDAAWKVLAERVEAMPLGRVLFHKGFFKDLNISTIKIRLEMPP